MGRAGYDFQSPDNEKPRLERGTEPCPGKSYSSTGPCSRASSTPWCARRSSGSSTRCPTLQADEIANAARYGRSGGRKAYRAGHYERSLTAKAGRPGLKVPKLKGALFASAVIERYRRRGESVEEALIDMCLAGVSTRQVDDTGQLLWGDRMPSPDIERQAQARVRRDRRMAHGAVGGRVPIRVRGRRVAQALLGRKRGERRHPGRHRRQQGWSPRGRRRRRGHGGRIPPAGNGSFAA